MRSTSQAAVNCVGKILSRRGGRVHGRGRSLAAPTAPEQALLRHLQAVAADDGAADLILCQTDEGECILSNPVSLNSIDQSSGG